MRQANHYKIKIEEQQKALILYDSLVDSFQVRLSKSSDREKNYLMIIENTNKAWETDTEIWENKLSIQKTRSKKKWWIIAPVAVVCFATGVVIAK